MLHGLPDEMLSGQFGWILNGTVTVRLGFILK